jgi:glycosyltransferase involved in cell wall biosynthesis
MGGLTWLPLRGGRIGRNLAAWRIAAVADYDIASLHDPELLPLGMFIRLVRRKPVVFDMHEDIPAQIATKPWLPMPLRRPLAWVSGRLLRASERLMAITVAEPSYLQRLRLPHPVIANHPDVDILPRAADESRSGAVYVGDVTVERGLVEAASACARLGLHLTVVGRIDDALADRLLEEVGPSGIRITGRLPFGQAMNEVASAAVALSPLRDLPNYRESIPTKVLEYLAIGVPVAASDLPATRALVEGLDAVVLHRPGDGDDLARAIETAMRPDMARKALGQVDEVRRRFRWPAAALGEIYERL